MIEVYSALCLKEPWLELILLRIKTLETRTKCLFKDPGKYVLTSSRKYDAWAWNHPYIGGLLNGAAKWRAMEGLGKMRAICDMGGFRVGVPGQDDVAARISIARENDKPRWVCSVTNPMRIVEVPTVRVQERGGQWKKISGATQGIFRVARSEIVIARAT